MAASEFIDNYSSAPTPHPPPPLFPALLLCKEKIGEEGLPVQDYMLEILQANNAMRI